MSESKDFKSNFIEFLRHSGLSSKDTLDDDLKLMGFDPKAIGDRGSQLAKEFFEKQLASERHAVHLARLRAQARLAECADCAKENEDENLDNERERL